MAETAVRVRPSVVEDVTAMVDLVEQRRKQYETYQPVFWRKAENSAQMSKMFFSALVANDAVTTLTAVEADELVGFAIVLETPAPPVVDPGGPTVTLDDFCVKTPDRWPDVGAALLSEVRDTGREKRWRQLVVICADADLEKKQFLQTCGLSIASNWLTAPF
jgi:hypothetical protein